MRRLRLQYPTELVVLGVHSAKFPAEKLTENIRAAAMRHGLDHPIVNDADFRIWSQYAVRAWPTVVLVDPAGKVVGQQAGELDAEQVAPLIETLIAEFAPRGLLDQTPVPGLRVEQRTAESLLRFPSKVLTATGGRLFVADTGHHRILEVQLSEDGLAGEVVRQIGSGAAGLVDGPSAGAQFHAPHGMAFRQTPAGSTLYVADTENHAVRAVDLVWDRVRTVAGTGRMGRGLRGGATAAAITVDLRSPWALSLVQDALLIAMAGSHQIWLLVDEERLGLFAGTGAEALIDGPRAEAAFNQPSDLVVAWGHLFVADAEAGAVRAVTLDQAMQVITLVGQGLFEFGDVDGVGVDVRLQHPTGLAGDGRMLYVADSYNHKIKTLDPATGAVQTLIGDGTPGTADGDFAAVRLYEPEGLAINDGRLYIADTNNHLIRVADLAQRQVTTLRLR